MSQKRNFVLGRTENIAEKEENAGNQHFFVFPQYFQKAFSILRVVKIQDCVVKGKMFISLPHNPNL